MKFENKVIVVTGGGSGMGRELVLQLLNKGARVATVDIHDEALAETKELAKEKASNLHTRNLNISDREQVESFPDEVIKHFGNVDGVINNAGIIQPFIDVNELDYDRIEHIMNINFYGTLYMTKAFLPHLLKRPEAHIANVSSMGGFIPFPGQTFYGASKAAVKLLTEGLYAELKETNVGVTVIHPGAINTNITKNSGVEMKNTDQAGQGKAPKMLSSEKAASIMLKAIEKKKFRVMVGSDARFLDLFYRLSPAGAVKFIVKQMSGMVNK